MKVDVLVVGGGLAGLSAVLFWEDAVAGCFSATTNIRAMAHRKPSMLSWARAVPHRRLSCARRRKREVARYESVIVRRTRVTTINPSGSEFEFECSDGDGGVASNSPPWTARVLRHLGASLP